jgi:hypothetical protein
MEITNLIKALMQFQAQIEPIKKDKDNPFFKSKYADLSTYISVCTPILHKNGLLISQTCRVAEAKTILITTLYHTSGEKIESEYILEPIKADPQAMGSAFTYARRYCYGAILGITADDDDDANRATYPAHQSRSQNGNNGTVYKQKQTEYEKCPKCQETALMKSIHPPAYKYCKACYTKFDPQMNVIMDREKVNA